MIVDEGEARINYQLIEIKSEYKNIVHCILYKNIEKRELEAIF